MSEVPAISFKLNLPQDVKLLGISIPEVREAMKKQFPLNPDLELAITDMNAKRRTEFAAGRICADRALRYMGIITRFPLSMRARLPLWPCGVVGSISHCSTMAVAMIASNSRYRALGVDVETIIGSDVASEIQQSICHHDELNRLENFILCRARSLTMLFSAKEALYKALFPLIGKFKDFHSAELCSFNLSSLVLRLTHDWDSRWCAGTKIKIHYTWLGQTVVSAIYIQRNRVQ